MIPYVTSDQISAIGTFGTALAAGFAVWQGFKSLTAWQRERIGGRKIELAEEALIQLYEMVNAMSAIRSPFGYGNEVTDRSADPTESAAQKMGRESGFRTFKRIADKNAIIENFRIISLKVRAVFGEQIFKRFDIIWDCLHEVKISAQMLYETPFEGYNDHDFRQKLERDIWYTGTKASADPSSIDARIKGSVDLIEKELGAVIGRY